MTDKQAERRAQIEAAAFEVLARVGFKKASMLQIARQAKASNETLYAWYGNKQALFSSLIESNARQVRDALDAAISGDIRPDEPLVGIATLLLQFTATKPAIIVNRAAVSDVQDTGLLARAIEQNARQVMYQRLEDLMQRLETTQSYSFDEGPQKAVQVFISLVLGELQMQQSLGAIEPLSPDQIAQHSQWACRIFDRLYRMDD